MSVFKKYTIKQILLTNQNWWRFYEKHKARIRPSITTSIIKLLSCKHTIRGYQDFTCSNPNCSHVKKIPFTCKCRACSSCGKKATEIWIQKQNQILPNTSWQHITFTMPCELWDFFWYNREFLNLIGAIAANCIMTISKKKKLIVGIFISIHTFGRHLKRNIHIHVSVTTGGVTDDLTQWKSIFFHQPTLMNIWRYQIINMFRKSQSQLIIPPSIRKQLHHNFSFDQFLNMLYNKTWIVHCSKPTSNHKKNVQYLGRYIKRPAIAESKLKHFDGNNVTFRYLDHNTDTFCNSSLSTDNFIARLIQHIPDNNFRMVRYYGFLANRSRGKLLPVVYQLLGQINYNQDSSQTYATLMQKNFNFNPLTCILCGHHLVPSTIVFGKNTSELLSFHRELALQRKC